MANDKLVAGFRCADAVIELDHSNGHEIAEQIDIQMKITDSISWGVKALSDPRL